MFDKDHVARFFQGVSHPSGTSLVFHVVMANRDHVNVYERNELSRLVVQAREWKVATPTREGGQKPSNLEFKQKQSEGADGRVVDQAFKCVAYDAFGWVNELDGNAQECFDAVGHILARHFTSEMDLPGRRCAAVEKLTSSAFGPSYDMIAILTRSLNSTGADLEFNEQDVVALTTACRRLDRRLKELLLDTFPIFSDPVRDGQPIAESVAVEEATAQLKEGALHKCDRLGSPFSSETERDSKLDISEAPMTPSHTGTEPEAPPPAPRKRRRTSLDPQRDVPARQLFPGVPKAKRVRRALMEGQIFEAKSGDQTFVFEIVAAGRRGYKSGAEGE